MAETSSVAFIIKYKPQEASFQRNQYIFGVCYGQLVSKNAAANNRKANNSKKIYEMSMTKKEEEGKTFPNHSLTGVIVTNTTLPYLVLDLSNPQCG